jgi:hypothetical protein
MFQIGRSWRRSCPAVRPSVRKAPTLRTIFLSVLGGPGLTVLVGQIVTVVVMAVSSTNGCGAVATVGVSPSAPEPPLSGPETALPDLPAVPTPAGVSLGPPLSPLATAEGVLSFRGENMAGAKRVETPKQEGGVQGAKATETHPLVTAIKGELQLVHARKCQCP